MLAAHRELKNIDVDTIELDEHLEQCSACRQVLAGYSSIGEHIRGLSALEPSPDMHTKLMQSLAAEHFQFIQRSPTAAPPPPDFLKPYMQEHAHSSHKMDSLAAFSTANTGALPVLPKPYKKRTKHRMGSQFALIGLAAVFLMALMMGSITSLLLLAQGHVSGGQTPAIVDFPTEVQVAAYSTHTNYQHVVSAIGDTSSIYYTAYGNDTNSGWMLEQMDRATRISTPLLASPSASPLIVLGSQNGWLVWLQFDAPKFMGQGTLLHTNTVLLRNWSLHYLSLAAPQHVHVSTTIPTSMTLVSGTFDQGAAPSWVHSPIQGIWFMQDTLLVASIGNNGVSHLTRYPLTPTTGSPVTEIAQASPEHIFTSPTANNDGSQMYWSEEWRTADGMLHSNIWTRQVQDTSVSRHGKLVQQPMIVTQLFLQDGMSFRPVVVDDALFLLNTGNQLGLASPTPGRTAQPAQTSTPVPSVTPNTGANTTSWADNSVYMPPLDNGVRGNLLMFPLNGDPTVTPTPIGDPGASAALQAGKDFVLWQSGDGSFKMYDAATKNNVIINEVLNTAQFVAVNGTTVTWTVDNGATTTNNNNNGSSQVATLQEFSWPRK